MFHFFRKKQPTEDSVTWSPPIDEDFSDGIKLCSNCQFKGKCQFRFGCKTLKQLQTKKAEELEKIRGFVEKNTDRETQATYLRGIGWRERLIDRRNANIKIVDVVNNKATVSVIIANEGESIRYNGVKNELIIDIPMTCNEYGRQVANIQQLRTEIRKEVVKLGR